MENIGGILYDVSVAVLGIAYPLAIIIFILGAVIISFKGREDIGDFYDKKIRRASRDSERKKTSRDPNWKEKKADEKQPHTKFKTEVGDGSNEGPINQYDGTAVGYYLPDSSVIRMYCDGEYAFSVFGEQLERPVSSEAEAKKIFDFYVLGMEIAAGYHKDISVDAENYSVKFQTDPTFFGSWFPADEILRLYADDMDTRERPASTIYKAEFIFDAFAWERGARLFRKGLQSILGQITPTINSDGSVVFEATRHLKGGWREYKGFYLEETIKLYYPPDVEQQTLPAKNRMEAILTFDDFVYNYDSPIFHKMSEVEEREWEVFQEATYR